MLAWSDLIAERAAVSCGRSVEALRNRLFHMLKDIATG
jgi:hypothetical protein